MGSMQWAVDAADELLTESGKPMTFFRETPEINDASKPWRTDGLALGVASRFTAIGMTVPYTQRNIDGTVIQSGDVKCYLAAASNTSYTPKVGDYSEFGGQRYKIINVSILEPGTDRILYELQMRG